jgi:hypothetical protein
MQEYGKDGGLRKKTGVNSLISVLILFVKIRIPGAYSIRTHADAKPQQRAGTVPTVLRISSEIAPTRFVILHPVKNLAKLVYSSKIKAPRL